MGARTSHLLRLIAVAGGLASLAGCFLLPGEDQGLVPGTDQVDFGFTFAAPELVEVQRGDSLSKLAQRHGGTVEDLRAWNALESDTLEVGQVLHLWRVPEAPVAVAAAPTPRPRGIVQRFVGGGARSPAPAPAPAPVQQVAALEPLEEDVTLAAVQPRRVTIEPRGVPVRGSGILDVNLGGANVDDLARSAQGMGRHDSNLGSGSLGGRTSGLGSGGDADTIDMPTREVKQVTPAIPNVAVTPPRLSKPAAKACLRGPSTEIGEDGMATNTGLSVSQINAGMGAISRHAVKCFPKGTKGSYTVVVEILVGCNGQVKNVYTISPGVVPSSVVSCIEQTLGYASFAAHAVPDGVSFQSPLKFSF